MRRPTGGEARTANDVARLIVQVGDERSPAMKGSIDEGDIESASAALPPPSLASRIADGYRFLNRFDMSLDPSWSPRSLQNGCQPLLEGLEVRRVNGFTPSFASCASSCLVALEIRSACRLRVPGFLRRRVDHLLQVGRIA